jgi:hypothetical protein
MSQFAVCGSFRILRIYRGQGVLPFVDSCRGQIHLRMFASRFGRKYGSGSLTSRRLPEIT